MHFKTKILKSISLPTILAIEVLYVSLNIHTLLMTLSQPQHMVSQLDKWTEADKMGSSMLILHSSMHHLLKTFNLTCYGLMTRLQLIQSRCRFRVTIRFNVLVNLHVQMGLLLTPAVLVIARPNFTLQLLPENPVFQKTAAIIPIWSQRIPLFPHKRLRLTRIMPLVRTILTILTSRMYSLNT